jgi:hypothetical protein
MSVLLAREGLGVECRIAAGIPSPHVHPRGIRVDPLIEVLGLEVVVGRLEAPAVLVRELGVKKVRNGFSFELGEVIQLSLASPLHPATSQDFAGHHLFGVPFSAYRVVASAILGSSTHPI